MRPLFQPRLVNDPFDDPGLFIAFQHVNRAILFDLGDVTGLSAREILKISHIFVTHTHMDHFIGFDRVLRLHLGRSTVLHLYGPRGFCDNVAGKLAGYTWNLVGEGDYPLILAVSEVSRSEVITRRYRCREKFRPDSEPKRRPFNGLLLEEPGFRVDAAVLSHGVPCLAFALKERFHINIIKNKLDELGLVAGSWLNEFKQALYGGRDAGAVISAPRIGGGPERRFAIGELADRIALITRGQKLAYVTDVADTPANRRRILALAGGCDRLFIEAAFLDADREMARAKHHLTARQAGELAALCGAGQLSPFHFSPRYAGDEERLLAEAIAAYEAGQPSESPA